MLCEVLGPGVRVMCSVRFDMCGLGCRVRCSVRCEVLWVRLYVWCVG